MGVTYNTSVVREGLVLHLDAANVKSYPGSGTTWFDLSGKNAHAVASNLPTYNNEGAQSYWSFDGTDDEFNSVDISQEYRDLFILFKPSSDSASIDMVFGKYDNLDYSFRIYNGFLRDKNGVSPYNTNTNDWQHESTSAQFLNGSFIDDSQDLKNKWNFIRSYRSRDAGFGTTFRYEISSSFLGDRRFKGDLALIMCYNRALSDSEVRQNFEALRGRYGI